MKVIFITYGLGLAGMPRVMINCAWGLRLRGHSVKLLTAFNSLKNDELPKKLDIKVIPGILPHWLLPLCMIFAYMKMVSLALYVVFWSGWEYDVVFIDKFPFGLPLVKFFSRRPVKTAFYVHYPHCLTVQRKTRLQKIFHSVMDSWELWSMKYADYTICNSHNSSKLR